MFILQDLRFVDKLDWDSSEMSQSLKGKLQPLLCFQEIKESLEIFKKHEETNDIIIEPGWKQKISTTLEHTPNTNDSYSFYCTIENSTRKIVFEARYDLKIDLLERFILNESSSKIDFKKTQGAPILSQTGELVAFVIYGLLDFNYLYGFSSFELKKYLDSYIETNFNDSKIGKKLDFGDNSISKKENTNLTQFINYKVFYGTNRNYHLKDNMPIFNNQRKTSLFLGCCEVSIPPLHEIGNLEVPIWFKKPFFKKSTKQYFTILKNTLIEKTRFIEWLKDELENSDDKDILLFVHGFNVTFDQAMMRSAQLGYDLNFKGAVTAFSWPSNETVLGYQADTDSSKFSSTYLSDFIKVILNTCKKLHIVAHSMGNVVLREALSQLREERVFPNESINQIILAAPDIDKDIFINQIMPKINRGSKLTLYSSDKDKALITSKRMRAGYERLGEGGDNIVILDGLDSIDASKINTDFLGHGYFAETHSLINDIHMVLLDLPPDKRILDEKNKIVDGVSKKYWAFRNGL
jgi:esterase/lipase superfamily enzyme